MAAIVDYYGCHEAVALYASVWYENLSGTLPMKFTRDVLLWMLVSSVFDGKKYLRHAFKVAIEDSNGPISNLGLPILPSIIGK